MIPFQSSSLFRFSANFNRGLYGALLLGMFLSACSESTPEAFSFAHSAVVKQTISRLQSSVDQDRITARPEGADEAIEVEQVAGLVTMLAHSTLRERALPLEDIKNIGEGALPTLVVISARTDKSQAERMAAVEMMAEFASPKAIEHLLKICESAPEPWIRSQAAWRLGTIAADWAVPRMVYRLKYEVDHEAAIWLANSLAQCGNYGGQDALYTVRSQGTTQALRERASEQLRTIAQEAGLSDTQELWNLWTFGDPTGKLLRKQPSDRLQLEVWKLISDLSGEHFQLRGVDDSRFILSHLGAWVTGPLCEALHDDDVYVRVHAAQCLARMGARASGAGPTLVSALSDPSLAPAAAAALGEIAYPLAGPDLQALLLAPTSAHELRVACASALGRMGLSGSAQSLETVLANSEEPFDLRQRAAISLCEMNLGNNAAAFLLAAMADPRADRFGAEVALGNWLELLETSSGKEALSAWQDLQPELGLIVTSEDAEERISTREALLTKVLPNLLAP
jgi:HEAT repeat protein